MLSGHFGSALQLIKVESRLQTADKFSYINALNLLYENFPSPQRRLVILSNVLTYYYAEENAEKVMHYLKLYLDQTIDNAVKKRILAVS